MAGNQYELNHHSTLLLKTAIEAIGRAFAAAEAMPVKG